MTVLSGQLKRCVQAAKLEERGRSYPHMNVWGLPRRVTTLRLVNLNRRDAVSTLAEGTL